MHRAAVTTNQHSQGMTTLGATSHSMSSDDGSTVLGLAARMEKQLAERMAAIPLHLRSLRDIKLSPAEQHPEFLYQLLKEREPHQNISHSELPTLWDHIAFVNSRPYWAWYCFEDLISGLDIGSVYLTKDAEIGIFILKDKHRQGYAKAAVYELMNRHPRKAYRANINPRNAASIAFFVSLGFVKSAATDKQVTYELAA